MIRPDFREIKHANELYHYGIKRRSGRYPWGSGERPYQSIPRRITKKVKDTYDKIPQPVKTTARIGAKVAGSVLISQALGVVGGSVVKAALRPDALSEGFHSVEEVSKYLFGVNKAQAIGQMTYSEITKALVSGTTGGIVVSEIARNKNRR